MADKPDTGEVAPDFTLPGTAGSFTLSDHRGERVLLLFYPGDNTAVCTKQFCSYRDREDDLGALGVTAVGISSQDLDSHRDFIERNQLTVPLLADVDKHVSGLYGVTAPVVGTRRATVLIDEKGMIRFRHVHLLGATFLTVDKIQAELAKLDAS